MVCCHRIGVAAACLLGMSLLACSESADLASDAPSAVPLSDASASGAIPEGPAAYADAAPTATVGDAKADAGAPSGAGARDAAVTPPVVTVGCAVDDDCRLLDDCCSCAAIAKSDTPPACEQKNACLQSACFKHTVLGSPRCVSNRCVLGFDCDTTTVSCRSAPPTCPAGQVPSAVGVGAVRCWGECVDARQCSFVPSCSSCMPGDVCWENGGRGHCVAPAP